MSTSAIATRDDSQMTQVVTATLEHSRTIKVVDGRTYDLAWEAIRGWTSCDREIVQFFELDKQRAHELHKSLCQKERQLREPGQQEIARLKADRARWRQEQERKQREEQARMAKEERKRQEALALEEAALLEKQGQGDLAAAVIEQAATAPPPVIATPLETPKNEGSSVAKKWRFRIVDADKVPAQFKIVDERKVRRVVDALGDKANIPGVEVYADEIERVRLS